MLPKSGTMVRIILYIPVNVHIPVIKKCGGDVGTGIVGKQTFTEERWVLGVPIVPVGWLILVKPTCKQTTHR